MSQTGIIILAHGSRGKQGIVEVPETLKRLADAVKQFLPTEVEIIGAALQFNQPNLEEAVASLVKKAVSRIVIMPYFLFSGRHITEDIPQLVERSGILALYAGVASIAVYLSWKKKRDVLKFL